MWADQSVTTWLSGRLAQLAVCLVVLKVVSRLSYWWLVGQLLADQWVYMRVGLLEPEVETRYALGWVVVCDDGSELGCPLGCVVGKSFGCVEGIAVGCDVGCREGFHRGLLSC